MTYMTSTASAPIPTMNTNSPAMSSRPNSRNCWLCSENIHPPPVGRLSRGLCLSRGLYYFGFLQKDDLPGREVFQDRGTPAEDRLAGMPQFRGDPFEELPAGAAFAAGHEVHEARRHGVHLHEMDPVGAIAVEEQPRGLRRRGIGQEVRADAVHRPGVRERTRQGAEPGNGSERI